MERLSSEPCVKKEEDLNDIVPNPLANKGTTCRGFGLKPGLPTQARSIMVLINLSCHTNIIFVQRE